MENFKSNTEVINKVDVIESNNPIDHGLITNKEDISKELSADIKADNRNCSILVKTEKTNNVMNENQETHGSECTVGDGEYTLIKECNPTVSNNHNNVNKMISEIPYKGNCNDLTKAEEIELIEVKESDNKPITNIYDNKSTNNDCNTNKYSNTSNQNNEDYYKKNKAILEEEEENPVNNQSNINTIEIKSPTTIKTNLNSEIEVNPGFNYSSSVTQTTNKNKKTIIDINPLIIIKSTTSENEMSNTISPIIKTITAIVNQSISKLKSRLLLTKQELLELSSSLSFFDTMNLFMSKESILRLLDLLSKLIYLFRSSKNSDISVERSFSFPNQKQSDKDYTVREAFIQQITYTERSIIYYKKSLLYNLVFNSNSNGNGYSLLTKELEKSINNIVSITGTYDLVTFRQLQNIFWVIKCRLTDSERMFIQSKLDGLKELLISLKKQSSNNSSSFCKLFLLSSNSKEFDNNGSNSNTNNNSSYSNYNNNYNNPSTNKRIYNFFSCLEEDELYRTNQYNRIDDYYDNNYNHSSFNKNNKHRDINHYTNSQEYNQNYNQVYDYDYAYGYGYDYEYYNKYENYYNSNNEYYENGYKSKYSNYNNNNSKFGYYKDKKASYSTININSINDGSICNNNSGIRNSFKNTKYDNKHYSIYNNNINKGIYDNSYANYNNNIVSKIVLKEIDYDGKNNEDNDNIIYSSSIHNKIEIDKYDNNPKYCNYNIDYEIHDKGKKSAYNDNEYINSINKDHEGTWNHSKSYLNNEKRETYYKEYQLNNNNNYNNTITNQNSNNIINSRICNENKSDSESDNEEEDVEEVEEEEENYSNSSYTEKSKHKDNNINNEEKDNQDDIEEIEEIEEIECEEDSNKQSNDNNDDINDLNNYDIDNNKLNENKEEEEEEDDDESALTNFLSKQFMNMLNKQISKNSNHENEEFKENNNDNDDVYEEVYEENDANDYKNETITNQFENLYGEDTFIINEKDNIIVNGNISNTNNNTNIGVSSLIKQLSNKDKDKIEVIESFNSNNTSNNKTRINQCDNSINDFLKRIKHTDNKAEEENALKEYNKSKLNNNVNSNNQRNRDNLETFNKGSVEKSNNTTTTNTTTTTYTETPNTNKNNSNIPNKTNNTNIEITDNSDIITNSKLINAISKRSFEISEDDRNHIIEKLKQNDTNYDNQLRRNSLRVQANNYTNNANITNSNLINTNLTNTKIDTTYHNLQSTIKIPNPQQPSQSLQNYIFSSNHTHLFFRGRDSNIHREYFALKCLEQENLSLIENNLTQFETKVLLPFYKKINFQIAKKKRLFNKTYQKYEHFIYKILGSTHLQQVKPYGSFANNFLIDIGDIDICIVPNNSLYSNPLEFATQLDSLKQEIKNHELAEVVRIYYNQKYMLLKMIDNETKITIDLTVHNMLPVFNTSLLKCYGKFDQRVHIIGLYIKNWAKINKIHGAAENFLSSYALLNMLIHFLQKAVEPKVLPVLQSEYSWLENGNNKSRKNSNKSNNNANTNTNNNTNTNEIVGSRKQSECNNYSNNITNANANNETNTQNKQFTKPYSYNYNNKTIEVDLYIDKNIKRKKKQLLLLNNGLENTESAASLLVKFFEYYAYYFDSYSHVISIKSEDFVYKKVNLEDQQQLETTCAFTIEDPFDKHHNPGRSMTVGSIQFNKMIACMKKEINFILNGEYVKRVKQQGKN